MVVVLGCRLRLRFEQCHARDLGYGTLTRRCQDHEEMLKRGIVAGLGHCSHCSPVNSWYANGMPAHWPGVQIMDDLKLTVQHTGSVVEVGVAAVIDVFLEKHSDALACSDGGYS